MEEWRDIRGYEGFYDIGLYQRGSRHYNAKLAETDVLQIRKMESISDTTLAKKYGVSREAIRDIQSRKRWKWLDHGHA